jgi:hypothetical protein
MKWRYILAPQAARDLVEIWRYIRKESSQEIERGSKQGCVWFFPPSRTRSWNLAWRMPL